MKNAKPSAQEDYESAREERRGAQQQKSDEQKAEALRDLGLSDEDIADRGSDRSGNGGNGTDFVQLEAPKLRHCKCGAINAADATRCADCGAGLGPPPPPPPSPSAPTSAIIAIVIIVSIAVAVVTVACQNTIHGFTIEVGL